MRRYDRIVAEVLATLGRSPVTTKETKETKEVGQLLDETAVLATLGQDRAGTKETKETKEVVPVVDDPAVAGGGARHGRTTEVRGVACTADPATLTRVNGRRLARGVPLLPRLLVAAMMGPQACLGCGRKETFYPGETLVCSGCRGTVNEEIRQCP